MCKERDSNFPVIFPPSKDYWEGRRDDLLIMVTIRDDTRNVINMQHITLNSKRWDYSDIPSGGHKNIKGPTHMAEGGRHLTKAPNSTHLNKWSVVTVLPSR